MKKVGKTTRPIKYDLNQFSYDYTVEVTNRFKGLDLIHTHKKNTHTHKDLIHRLPEELCTEVCDIVQEAGDQDHSQGKEMQKGKMVV